MAQRSLKQIFREITGDVKTLAQEEKSLATAEVKAGVTKLGIGGGLLGAALFFVLMAVIILLFAASAGIHAAGLSWWLSFLIVGVALIVLGAILALIGIPFLKKGKPVPTQAIDGAKSTLNAVKSAAKNPSGPQV